MTGERPGTPSAGARIGVVGHVEWVDFAVVDRLPRASEIVTAREHFAEPAGGGGVAAVQLTRLTGACLFLTAVGGDALGDRAHDELRGRHGVDVHAAVRTGVPQRRAFTHLSRDDRERTITVIGERIVPRAADALPWDRLAELDGVYFTGGDADALRAARAARVLVATPRALDAIRAAHVELDVLVASATDAGERVDPSELDPPPRHVVLTEGAAGGRWTTPAGRGGRWSAVPLPGAAVDSFGCGDTFAAVLTLALGAGQPLDAALAAASRSGAAVLTGRGPYGAPLPAPRPDGRT